jgi:CheY-like chemotaxis protein
LACAHPHDGPSRARRTDMMQTAAMNGAVANWLEYGRLCHRGPVRPRVLVVDDDTDLCEVMAQLLAFEGFETDVARNGQEALEKAHANPPRVIVLDMAMPVMDGWAFRAHQRQCVALAAIPVIIVSAMPLAVCDAGAVAVLQKPFQKREFIAAVCAVC